MDIKIEDGQNIVSCENCANNSQKGTCLVLNIVPMSKDGKGIVNCEKWEVYGEIVGGAKHD